MDLSRTQLSGLLNNTTHEKAKYIPLLYKLNTLLGLAKDHKLILSSLDKLIVTSIPGELYRHVNYKHPILKLLTNYIGRLPPSSANSSYFVELVKSLIGQAMHLLENGIRAKQISDIFKEAGLGIRTERDKQDSDINGEGNDEVDDGELPDGLEEYIHDVIRNKKVADLVVEAIKETRSVDEERIRVAKVPVRSLGSSYRVNGLIINRAPDSEVKELHDTSVGIFNCPLDINRPELKGTVLFQSPEELANYSKEETEGVRRLIDSLNVNVAIVSGRVDSMFLEFANKRNLMILRVFNKFDLKRICDCVGGSVYNNLGPVAHKGHVERMEAFKDAGYDFTVLVGQTTVNTVVLKCSVKEVLDEMERVILGLLTNLKQSRELPGGLAVGDCHELLIKECAAACPDGGVKEAMLTALKHVSGRRMLLADQRRCMRYAIEFIGVLLEIDDYLVARRDVLDVKPPKPNGHWDEDH